MTDVIGLMTSVAKERLQAEGFSIATVAVHSRKGSNGDDSRVLRQFEPDERGVVRLDISTFLTEPEK